MLNVAVIGVGAMGKNHARIYSELKNVNLVAIADSNEERVKKIASMYKTKYYTDYKQMIDKEKIDLISIVVPTKLHKMISKDVLNAGIHALIEKPMASSTEEAKEMIGLVKKNGIKMTIGHIERFNPLVRELKKQIKRLGKIYSIEIRRSGPFPARVRDVGVIVDLGVHDFDIMRFVLNSEPTRIYTEIQQNVHTDFEDLAKIVLKFKNNVVGTLDINWLTPKKTREIVVLGEHGMLKGDLITQHLEFYKNNDFGEYEYEEILRGDIVGEKEDIYVNRVEPLKLELESFANCIINGGKPFVTAEDGLSALRIAEKALESAKTNKTIEIN